MRVEPTFTPRGIRRCGRAVIALPNPLMRAFLADLLRLDGYDVSEATDGEELLFYLERAFAFDAREGASIDLIVTDLWMPYCSGLDVLQRLREAHRTMPVVILTADVDDRSLRSRVERLDGRLLTKPFMFDALRGEIHALDQPRLH